MQICILSFDKTNVKYAVNNKICIGIYYIIYFNTIILIIAYCHYIQITYTCYNFLNSHLPKYLIFSNRIVIIRYIKKKLILILSISNNKKYNLFTLI